MSLHSPRALVLIGPPGAGCSSVGRAIGAIEGLPVLDLGRRVADKLGTSPDLALVAVPEADYRRAEARVAGQVLDHAMVQGAVVALGSGCLSDSRLRERLEDMRLGTGQSHRVVALVCATRVLATRNGLDAPRSVGLGNVHHQFVQMLHTRQDRCRELADLVVDTTATTPEEAGEEVVRALARVSPLHS